MPLFNSYYPQNLLYVGNGVLLAPSPLIPDSGTMLTNVYIDDHGAIVDTQGKAWGKVGTPITDPWTSNTANGYGNWSGSFTSYFTASVAALAPTGNFMATVVLNALSAFGSDAVAWQTLDNAYYLDRNSAIDQIVAGASLTDGTNRLTSPGIIVWSFGRDGTNIYQKKQRFVTKSAAKGSPVAKTGISLVQGTVAGQQWPGVIYSFWMSADPWDETAITARNSGALAFFGV
jgi:hypothetical protein